MCPSPATRTKPLVFLVEPHPLAIDSLRDTLREKNRVRIASEEKFLNDGLPFQLDPVFVIDKGMARVPFTKYLDGVRLRLRRPKVIVMDRDCLPEDQIAMLYQGIRGVVAYRDVRKKLDAAIAEVARGGLWVAREILTDFVTGAGRGTKANNGSRDLTTRELQVLRLVEKYLSNKEIGATLSISESTVKFHLANIFGKLHVRNRRSAVHLVEDHLAPVQSSWSIPRLLFATKSA